MLKYEGHSELVPYLTGPGRAAVYTGELTLPLLGPGIVDPDYPGMGKLALLLTRGLTPPTLHTHTWESWPYPSKRMGELALPLT